MVGSLGGQALQPDMGLYSASKAALHHLTRILAAELGPEIRVNAVAPGLPADPRALGRLGEVDDIANTVDFLIDERSSWMTGQVLVVDGGASVQLGRRGRRPAPEVAEVARP